MSAFVVSKEHVAAIVRWYLDCREKYDNFNWNDGETWANRLMKKNVESVAYRYRESEESVETITQTDLASAIRLKPVEVLKAISCLDYQSCELPTWEESEECKFLERVKSVAISCLPGYESAPWSIIKKPKEEDAVMIKNTSGPQIDFSQDWESERS